MLNDTLPNKLLDGNKMEKTENQKNEITKDLYIAVADATNYMGTGPSQLRQYLLMYDDLHLLHLEATTDELRHGDYAKPRYADEFDWLVSNNAIKPASLPDSSDRTDAEIEELIQNSERELKEFDILEKSEKPPMEFDTLGNKIPAEQLEQRVNNMAQRIWSSRSLLSRATAAAMRLRGFSRAYSIDSTSTWTDELPGTKRGQVIQIVINEFPKLTENLPLADILQLRVDDEFRQRRNGIRLWVRKASESKASISDIRDELQYQLNEYERYMNAVNIKYSLTSVSSIAKFAAGFAADIATLRWKDAIDSAFSLAVIPASLTEAEAKAPGRELSFINYVSKRF